MPTKTIWMTGCTSGLGRALVDEFTAAGHTVVGCGRRIKLIEQLQHAFPAPHFFSSVDVAEDHAVKQFCHEAYEAAGAPDLLLNNAATVNEPAPLWEISADEFDRVTAININGTANMIRHAVPMMIERGKGIIVNLSSGWGRSTSPTGCPLLCQQMGHRGAHPGSCPRTSPRACCHGSQPRRDQYPHAANLLG